MEIRKLQYAVTNHQTQTKYTMEPQKFSWRGRIRSFTFAFNGIARFFRYEHNAWIHGIAALLAITGALILKISPVEMTVIIIAITLVWIAEMCNTAIEKIMDHLSPETHPAVKAIKDIAAGAVLIAAFSAFVIGLIIFLPRLI